MGLSTTVKNAMLDWFFSHQATGYSPPDNFYVALIKGDGTEVIGNNYARVSTDTSDWGAAATGTLSNTSLITFPAPTGPWGSISAMKIYNQASGGTELFSATLTTVVTVPALSQAPEFAVGSITISLTGSFNENIRNSMLDYYFNQLSSAYDIYDDFYVALFDSGDAEISGNGYARVHITTSDWSDASGGISTNASTIIFPQATGNWSNIQDIKLYDRASGGIELATLELPSLRDVTGADAPVEIPIGNLRALIT